ncbi:MAG: PDZ domain-containing protein [Planctomycetaceae bacterium]|nr:MAG: PDZ domain-containing protein [Planctomycetaceae bacterium]
MLGLALACAWLAHTASASEVRHTPIVRAVDRAQATVVNIHSERTQHGRDSQFESGGDRKLNGMGTGIIIDERGYILTNHHVVAKVETLRATLHDGASFDATIIDVDPAHDLAVIKIDAPQALPVSPMGTSSDLKLGETVIAIGNALGYEHTVTAGIISSLVRDVEAENQSYHNLLQIDAAINPGNSGGPLINLDGEVIAINVAIRANAQKIGFAIKIDDARSFAAQLMDIRRRSRTWHGLTTRDVKTPSIRQLVVLGAESGSPAAQAGFRNDDVIVQIDSTRIEDGVDLERSLLGVRVGEPVPVVVNRGGSPLTLSLRLAAYEGKIGSLARKSGATSRNRIVAIDDPVAVRSWKMLGLKLSPASDTELWHVREKYTGGMKVVDVRGDSPAFQNGIRKGDILVGLHEFETKSLRDIDYIITKSSAAAQPKGLRYLVVRGREVRFGSLDLSLPVAAGESTRR